MDIKATCRYTLENEDIHTDLCQCNSAYQRHDITQGTHDRLVVIADKIDVREICVCVVACCFEDNTKNPITKNMSCTFNLRKNHVKPVLRS